MEDPITAGVSDPNGRGSAYFGASMCSLLTWMPELKFTGEWSDFSQITAPSGVIQGTECRRELGGASRRAGVNLVGK